jgi:hypothetical protein
MIQLFFLSILFNGLSGYVLVTQEKWENGSIENSLKLSPSNETFRLVLGILTAVTGFLKLLSPVMGTTPFLGDLVPALAGIAGGFILVFAYYRDHAQDVDGEGKFDRIGNTFLRGKKTAGIILLASALLHFLFPQALFL